MNLPRLPALVALAAFITLSAMPARAQDPQKPEAKPEAEVKQEPARPEPGPGQEPDPKIIEDIVGCLAEGLPQGWAKTWIVINEVSRDASGKSRDYKAVFRYSTKPGDKRGKPFVTCGPDRILDGVGALNAYLPADQQRWTGATISFYSDGKFEAQYDYTPRKPARPAAKKKPDAKK